MPTGNSKTPVPPTGTEVLNDAERSRLEKRVLDHFRRNSRAMDSAEGVARFWVGENHHVVERCLIDLHHRGLLQKRTIAGTDLYSLEKDRELTKAESGRPDAEPRPESTGRILIADDDSGVRGLIAGVLTEAGHSVAMADDGDRAIEMLGAGAFDLVITDLLMPGASGIQVLRAVKQHCPSTEVIVVTAHAALETAIEALRLGAYDLITKPLDDIELLERAVERVLQKRRLSMENSLLVDTLQKRNLELRETVARLAAVNEIGKATIGLLNLQELYDSLVRMVAQHLQAHRVSILVCEPDSDTMRLVASVGITKQEALESRVQVGDGIAGRVAASQEPLLVEDIEKTELKSLRRGTGYRTPSFLIAPLMVSYPIRYQRKRVGVINASDKRSGDPFNEQDLEFVSTLSSQVAVAIEHARLIKGIENGYLAVLMDLIQAVEDSYPKTRGHSRKVAELAGSLARAMGLAEPRIQLLVRAAALHSVGRLSTRPDGGAKAKGRPQIWEEWSPTAVMAAQKVLAPIATLREEREIILHSTNPFDTTLSVLGVDCHGIPVESRILAVCEEFVRRTAGNGRDAKVRRQALEAIRNEAGGKHDPHVVAALGHLIEAGEAG